MTIKPISSGYECKFNHFANDTVQTLCISKHWKLQAHTYSCVSFVSDLCENSQLKEPRIRNRKATDPRNPSLLQSLKASTKRSHLRLRYTVTPTLKIAWVFSAVQLVNGAHLAMVTLRQFLA